MEAQGPQDSWIGRTVSHYRVVEKLGRGGMGIVYKAEDLMLERSVALKVLPPGQEGEPARQRLLEEARAASVLDHPNVCAIYEAEETGEPGPAPPLSGRDQRSPPGSATALWAVAVRRERSADRLL